MMARFSRGSRPLPLFSGSAHDVFCYLTITAVFQNSLLWEGGFNKYEDIVKLNIKISAFENKVLICLVIF